MQANVTDQNVHPLLALLLPASGRILLLWWSGRSGGFSGAIILGTAVTQRVVLNGFDVQRIVGLFLADNNQLLNIIFRLALA